MMRGVYRITQASLRWPKIAERGSLFPNNHQQSNLFLAKRNEFHSSAWLPKARGKNGSNKNTENSKSNGESKSKGSKDEKSQSLGELQKALEVIESSLSGSPTASLKSELLVLPVTQRPLFPGFYKALTVKDPKIVESIKENLAKSRAYVSVFLARDDDFQGNTVRNFNDIHHTGVLAQIYNIIAGPNDTMTLLVFPSKRVTLKKLILPAFEKKAAEVTVASVDEDGPESVENDEKETNSSEDAAAAAETPATEESVTDAVEAGSDAKNEPVLSLSPTTKVPKVVVELLKEDKFDKTSKTIHNCIGEIMDTLNEIVRLNPLVRDQMAEFMRSLGSNGSIYDDPIKMADFAASMSDAESFELQEILESTDVVDRLRKSLMLLKKERINADLQYSISQDIEKMLSEKHREYFLQEKLRGIQKELGLETNSRDKLIEKYRSRVSKLVLPDTVRKVFDEELGKLAHLKPSAQEYNLTSNYLDWITQIPWGKCSSENFDISKAQTVLDSDHYGMKDVKDRILEFIAVGKMRGGVHGKILLLSGPPGVGKTSIGKSIARSLNREFYRFSVGGLYDVAEIKGHRRTYVGAMPGKLVQALKKVQTENPLVLIDEVDKIGHGGNSGDPSAALLEVLDPEQNSSFLDHYLDVPIDLSNVLFVCTANNLETIPGPLLDRMEVINLSGYVAEEKVQIATKYLIPQAFTASGLKPESVELSEDAIKHLMTFYCRESGVRNLKKHIEKIFRKAALKSVEASQTTSENDGIIKISTPDLKEYVGNPVYPDKRLYKETPVGVIPGLAFNSIGGSTLYIESVLDSPLTDHSSPGFSQTGNMGSVMKESSEIAYSFAKAFIERTQPDNTFFDRASIHLHVPEGATPKDGPSAGVTMASSLLSLALNRPISNVAMTGELTLTGKVLKIGGVKEKVMAAKRSDIHTLIMPKSNQADYEELADYIREGMTAHFVDTYDEVFRLLFS